MLIRRKHEKGKPKFEIKRKSRRGSGRIEGKSTKIDEKKSRSQYTSGRYLSTAENIGICMGHRQIEKDVRRLKQAGSGQE